eukprot:scaffold27051_cov113-Skeletonema_menzelii.AAC.5
MQHRHGRRKVISSSQAKALKHQAKTRQTLDAAPSRTKKSHIQQPSESTGKTATSILSKLLEKSQQKHQAKTRQTLDAAPSRTKKSHIQQPSTTSSNASSNECNVKTTMSTLLG